MDLVQETDVSRRDLRRALRALPARRRRAVARAVREGRCVDDPRDAALTVTLARRLQAAWWPHWLLPEQRPRGRRKVLWLLHTAWLTVAMVTVFLLFWRMGGALRWVAVAVLAYSLIGTPWTLAHILLMRWNAPDAERRNRELTASEDKR